MHRLRALSVYTSLVIAVVIAVVAVFLVSGYAARMLGASKPQEPGLTVVWVDEENGWLVFHLLWTPDCPAGAALPSAARMTYVNSTGLYQATVYLVPTVPTWQPSLAAPGGVEGTPECGSTAQLTLYIPSPPGKLVQLCIRAFQTSWACTRLR